MENDSIVMFQKILETMETVLTKVKIIEKKVAKSDDRMKDLEESLKKMGDNTAMAIKEVNTVSVKTSDKEACKKLETISVELRGLGYFKKFTVLIFYLCLEC